MDKQDMRVQNQGLRSVGEITVIAVLLLAIASCATTEKRSASESEVKVAQAAAGGIKPPTTIEEAIRIMDDLPSPCVLQHRADTQRDQERLFAGLTLLASMSDPLVNQLYVLERQDRYLVDFDNKLLLLTRVRYHVERIDKAVIVRSLMFGPEQPEDWLWPIRIGEENGSYSFTLNGSPPVEPGLIMVPTDCGAEYEKAKNLAAKRDLTKFVYGKSK